MPTPQPPQPHPLDQHLPLPELQPPPHQTGITLGLIRLADALDRVTDHADADWWREALSAVTVLATQHPAFTTDQVWQVLAARAREDGQAVVGTHERRALGAVMRAAARARLIAPTDRYVPTERPEAHRRPVKVWRSLVCAGAPRG